MTRVAVLGPGGVGGFLAAALERATPGSTVVVAREPTAAMLAGDGLRLRSRLLGDVHARPEVTERLDMEVDALLVTTKAGGMADALERIGAPPGLVVPLLNGVEHLARLRERFGAARVPAAVIRLESDRPAPGEIVQSSPGARIDLAADDPGLAARLPALADVLRDAGLEVRIGEREADVMWSKLARLCPLALTTTAGDRPLGEIRDDPRWRSALDNAVAETIAVAVAEGAHLNAADTLSELEAAHASLGSSMRRDVAAGREPELDAIAGAVIRAGTRHGLRCPTLQWLSGRVARRVRAAAAPGKPGAD